MLLLKLFTKSSGMKVKRDDENFITISNKCQITIRLPRFCVDYESTF